MKLMGRACWLLVSATGCSVSAFAQHGPSLSMPLDCALGSACIVQNYVDRDPGPEARDYRCGFLTYDGHKGTDFRVVDQEVFRRGVAVLAAAPGVVRALRDGMPDVNARDRGKEAVSGREAGNSVVIDHGDGWETQYAHLRQGSVVARRGEAVKAGQKLGLVGLSGNTEFPHLHFEVRYQRKTIDPFVGAGAAEACKAGARALWRERLQGELAYVATGLLNMGIAATPPKLKDSNVDPAQMAQFTDASPAAVFWVQIYGARENDLEELRLLAPDGRPLVRREDRISRNRAQWLVYSGLRRPEGGWTSGTYRGEYTLYRGAQRDEILRVTHEVRLPPQATKERGEPK